MTLGEQIAQLRKQRKMSQEELATAMEVSRQAVSKWENGLSNPDTENLIRLAKILEVDMNTLISSQVAAENRLTQEKPAADHNKTVRLLSGLLALAVCAAVLFAGLWLAERNRQDPDASGRSTAPEEAKMWWDSAKMYTGLMHEEVALTSAEKKALVDYISRFHFVEETEEKTDGGNYLCGGRMYYVEYERDAVLFHWYFSENGFSQAITFPDGSITLYSYITDYTFLYKVDTYVY